MRSERWKAKTWEEIEAWKPWFAWRPVTAEDGAQFRTVWWEWIERRQRYLHYWDRGPLPTEYRIPQGTT